MQCPYYYELLSSITGVINYEKCYQIHDSHYEHGFYASCLAWGWLQNLRGRFPVTVLATPYTLFIMTYSICIHFTFVSQIITKTRHMDQTFSRKTVFFFLQLNEIEKMKFFFFNFNFRRKRKFFHFFGNFPVKEFIFCAKA